MDTFFHCLRSFSGFSSQSNPHSEDLFLTVRNARFPNLFYSIHFFCLYVNRKNKLQQERYISLSPLNKTFTLCAPHNNYPHPHPHIIRTFRSNQKILLDLSQSTNNWLGKEGTKGWRLFYSIFKNVLFFHKLYRTEY